MQKIIGFVIVYGVVFSMGFIASFYFKDHYILSDRKDLCEQKGGKYNYLWLSGSGKYYEVCESEKKEIKL